MKQRGLAIVAVIIAIAAGVLLWSRHRGGDAPATATHAHGSARAAGTAIPHDEAAHAIVTVTDAKGPIAGAIVRFAGDDIAIARTGADGIARLDLAAAKWMISASADDHEPAALPERAFHAGETVQLALVLATGGRTLRGVVTDATGGPIAGARVDAAKLGGLVRPSDAVASTSTGTDGHYKLTVAQGQLLVAASSSDYAPQSRYVEVGASGATADFQLVPGGVIEGVVRDEHSREPIAGATVAARRDAQVMRLGEAAEHDVTTSADGRFRITGLRPGAFELRAHAAALTSRAPTLVGLGVAEQVTDIELLVGIAPVIRGTVVDEAGTLVADVAVSAGDNSAVTTAKGEFVIAGLAPGQYALLGRGDDVLPAGPTRVTLADRDLDHVVVHVRRGIWITGHVEPRQSCEVRLDVENSGGGELIVAPVTTTDDGEFSVGPTGKLPYSTVTVATIAARCGSGDQGTQTIHLEATNPPVVVHVTAGASVAGRVVDGSGKPVVAVAVMAAPIGQSEHTMIVNGIVTSGAQTLTDDAGAYELRGLAAGTYRLSVLDRGRPLPMKATTKVELAATDHKVGVELAVDRPDGVIRGTVTDQNGKPVADAWVSVEQELEDLLGATAPQGEAESKFVTIENRDDGENATAPTPALTDATGHFEIAGLARVPWTVVAEAQGGSVRGRAPKVTPDATITIQALGLTELHGTAHATGPLDAFTVELDGPTHAQRSFAAADGTFSFGRVEPGNYTVKVTSSAGNGEATVQVVSGQAANVDVTLASNAVVIGKLVDPTGKPVGGIAIAVVPDAGDGKVSVSIEGPPPASEADGSFRIETKAGKSVLVVLVQPRPITKKGLVLVAGQTFDAGSITVTPP